MSKILEKVIALILIVVLASANLIILGEYTIVHALSDEELIKQDSSTNHKNVEFNSYFYGEVHNQVFNVGSQDAKIYLKLNVKNAGYLQNGTIEFQNTNFKIKDGIQNENIQSIDNQNNKIILNKINNGSDITIEIPIEILKNDNVSLDYFNKEILTKFTGTYFDGSGKEKEIEKEVINKLSWKENAEAEVKVTANKFVPYATNGNYGVMLQTKINSNIKNSSLPIHNTNLEITVPIVNDMKPTTVNVIATNTLATNGKADGLEFNNTNYSYNQENGKVTINVSNLADSISWTKNVSDEYLVTYLFEGQDIYNFAKENGINSSIVTDANITVYNNEENVINSNITTPIKYTEKEGTLTDFALNVPDKISKGYIYANYDATDKIETEYLVNYVATVNSAKLTNSLEFIQSYDKFITNDDKEGLTTVGENNYSYNKRIEVSQAEFNKMLGEDGTITIKDEKGEVLGTINKETNLENGIYSLDISDKNNNKLDIVTSAPITEGQLKVNVVKAIKGDIDYSKDQMKDFTKMKVEFEGKTNTTTYTAWKEIGMKEPVTKAELFVTPQNLSTIITNENVEMRVVLNTSNTDYALYKNPVFEIELPKDITKVELRSVNLLLDEQLKIKSSEVISRDGKQVIRVVLEGTQTKYYNNVNQTEISNGANIVIKANLTLDKFTSNKTEIINMIYKNENTDLYENMKVESSGIRGETSTKVNLVAPSGITTTNNISNYAENSSQVIAISDEMKEINIPVHSASREMTIGGTIINNYTNHISNVVILGRLPSKDNKNVDTNESLGSNFNITLSEKINLTGTENATIYYSENVDATNDIDLESNGWTIEPTNLSNVKSYMIVLSNNMPASDRIEFSYKATIPENLEYDSNSYEMYKVFYTNNSDEAVINETKVSPVICLKTGQGPELKLTMTSNVKQEDGVDIIRQGEMVRVWVTVENTGKLDAENVKLNVNKPEELELLQYNNSYSGYEVIEGNEVTLGTIKVGESITYSFDLQLKESFEVVGDDIENIGRVTLNITADNMDYTANSDELVLSYRQAFFTIKNIPSVRENYIYTTGSKVEYEITIINQTEGINNFELNIPLPDDLKEIDGYWTRENEQDRDGVQISTNKITATKSNLDTGINKFIVTFRLGSNTQTSFSTQVNAKGKINIEGESVDTGIHYSNERFVNKGAPELSGKQLELDDAYIKEGKEFSYRFEIKTGGTGTQNNFIFEDILSEELEYVRANIDVRYPGAADDESIDISYKDNTVTGKIDRLQPNATINIEIVVKGHLNSEEDNEKAVINKATIVTNQVEKIELNSVTAYIEYDKSQHIDPENPENPENPSSEKNKISGVAWIDSNQDGRRDSEEELLSGIQVMLLNKTKNELLKDYETGKEKIVTTGNDGKYTFDNVENGNYIVIFLYDASQYSITAYKKDDVEESVNSDAVSMKIILNGEQKEAGVTDIINVSNENARNIDIGLYLAEKFDLRLDKYISKITLTTPTIGTQVTNFNNSKLQKVEILDKNINQSSLVVEYKIVVTNEGRVAGYAKKIVDYLPETTKFDAELNTDWYISNETNSVYNASLANEKIEPGESKEISLILSMQITTSNIGKILTNTAEICESYNEQGIPDVDSTEGNMVSTEDDLSEAEILLSIVTGNSIIIYITIGIVIILILGVGIYEIKKRVLGKK